MLGTIAWQVAERLLTAAGWQVDLSVGPLGFDLQVIAVHLQANPGTVLGAVGGWLLIRAL